MSDFQLALPFAVNRPGRRRLARIWAWAITRKRQPVRHVHIRQVTEAPARFWLATRIVWNGLLIVLGLSLLVVIFNAWLLLLVLSADRPEGWQALRQYLGQRIDQAELAAGLGCLTWMEVVDDGDPRASYRIERSDGPACRHPPAWAVPRDGHGPVPPAPDAPPASSEGDAP